MYVLASCTREHNCLHICIGLCLEDATKEFFDYCSTNKAGN
jgi:hypothetical protein